MNIKSLTNIFFIAGFVFIFSIIILNFFRESIWTIRLLLVILLIVFSYVLYLFEITHPLFYGILVITIVLGVERYEKTNRIYSVPQKGTYEIQVVENPTYKDQRIRTKAILDTGQPVLLYIKSSQKLEYRDTGNVNIQCKPPENFLTSNKTIFDYVRYLKKDSIYAICEGNEFMITSQGKSIVRYLFTLSNAISERIHTLFIEPHNQFISGVLVGDKKTIDPTLRDTFLRTGTIHILALSGYNIAIVAFFFQRLFSFFFRRKTALIISLIAIMSFVAMTGFSSSAVRAGLMASIVIYATLSYEKYNPLRALFVVSLGMIVFDPRYLLYDSSFHLSVLATFGIIVGTPLFELLFQKIKMTLLRTTLSTTLSAYIITLPYVMYYFKGISLIGILANALVVPLVPLLMLTSTVTFFLSLIQYNLAFFSRTITHSVSEIILSLISYFSNYQYAYIQTSITYFTMMVLYIIIFLFWYFFYTREKKKNLKK